MSANDSFATALQLVSNAGVIAGDTTDDTVEDGELNAEKTAWFKWTAADADVFEAHLFGVPFDAVLSVYTGSAVDALTLVVSNDDASPSTGGGATPPMVAFLAQAGTTYFLQVGGYSAADYGPFTLHWATGHAQANDWFSAAAYWAEVNYDGGSGGNVELVKAPAPTAKLVIHTPSAPALLKRTTPGSTLFLTKGAANWYPYPLETGQDPLLNGFFRGEVWDPNGFVSANFPYYDQYTVSPPALVSEYLSPGLFSVGGFVRPVFGPAQTEQVAFEIEFMLPDGAGLARYDSPVVAALSGFALAEWTPGDSNGSALHGFVSKDAVPPYAPTDLLLGIHVVVSGEEVRTDTVYVEGVAVRTVTVGSPDFNTALSVRTSISGANPGEVTTVSVSGSSPGSGASAQTHGVSNGLVGCKYVYQSQFNANVAFTVGSQFTMLTQPYGLGAPPAAFWGRFVDTTETLRVVT